MPSERYNSYIHSPLWYARSKAFKAATGGRCAMIPLFPANVSHHLTYDNLENEKYIRDCIPLSHFAHGLIHTNPIGKYFWKDRLGRRRWMNAALRAMAILVTICAQTVIKAAVVIKILGTIYAPFGQAVMFAIGIYARCFGIFAPKLRAKPKLKRKRKADHIVN